MDFLRWLFDAQIPVAGSSLLLREVVGNIFGLLSALGGMRRESSDGGGHAVTPRWAPAKARVGLVAGLLLGTVALTPLFRIMGPYEPVWADAWTFVGSLLATFGMAKGWVEFWMRARESSKPQVETRLPDPVLRRAP